jgi:oligopeptide/dipeptide ABC transporter ATP-binding protein
MSILQVKQLRTSFATEKGRVQVLDGINLQVNSGETLGIVGESGCGKSITALSIMRLLPQPSGQIDGGEILFDGQDLARIPASGMHSIRGNQIAMIFQEPMTALNPVQKIGRQMQEPFLLHRPDMSAYDRIKRATELLTEVGISSPQKRLNEYPHQLSGGMRQRVMIAIALALKPALLIADEPTTALDVTIQAQILALIKTLRERHGTAVMLITHDLGVIAETCDTVLVMYAGRVAESAGVARLFAQPSHPYTQGLLASIPRLDAPARVVLNTIPGVVPSIDELGEGCRFADRCRLARAQCSLERPPLATVHTDQQAACLFWQEAIQ